MDFVKAFIIGGLICVIGQLLLSLTSMSSARILVLFVVGGAVLSALGLYGPLVEFAGAGATVPLLGFGHSLAQGAKEAVLAEGLFGVIAGGVIATAAGVAAAIFFGWRVSIIFTPKVRK